MDSSGSVRHNYGDQKNFVKQMIASYKLDSESPVAGVVSFSHEAVHNIRLKDFKMKDLASFNNAVDDIPYLGKTSQIDKALKIARDELFTSENGARDNIPKVIFIIIDGTQTSDTDSEDPDLIADQLRETGILTFVVGVGYELTPAVLDRLAGGRNETVFYVSSFEGLNETLIDDMVARTCELIDGNFCSSSACLSTYGLQASSVKDYCTFTLDSFKRNYFLCL